MNKLLLRLVMFPSKLWQGMGADIEQLRAILTVKLKMDDRKPLNFGRQQSSNKKAKFTSALTVLVSFFSGLIYVLPLLLSLTNTVISLTLFYTLFIFFLTFTLITDFSSTLIDTRDKHILFSKPINDRTIFLARMLHIFIYLFRIILPMSLPGWITFGIIKGWKGALLFPFPLLLMLFIVLFFVNAIYMVLIKLTKPAKFKEVINYFQIAFSIIFFASYYLLPRFLDEDSWGKINVWDFEWMRWLPSYWLAAAWNWVLPSRDVLPGTNYLAVLSIIFPVLCIWVTIKYLAPNFIHNISALDGVETEKDKRELKGAKKGKLYNFFAHSFNRTDAAKAGFIMTWLQTSRSRTFKMRVYPLFAYVPIYFAYLLFTGGEDKEEVWSQLPQSDKYLMLLYMSAFVLLQSLNYMTLSDQYKAAWIYHSAPLEKPGFVMAGAFKAMWVKYFLPFISLISLFVLYVWGAAKILDVVLAITNVTLFAVCIVRIAYRNFPFSMMEQMNNTGGKAIFRVLFTFLLISALGFGHYLSTYLWWLKLLFLLLSLLLLWLVWDSYRNTSWKDLHASEEFA